MFLFWAASWFFADEPSGETREDQLRQQVGQLLETVEGSDWIPLIMADLELSKDLTTEFQDCCRRILRALSAADDEAKQQYVRAVFENEPERRGWLLRLSRWPHRLVQVV